MSQWLIESYMITCIPFFMLYLASFKLTKPNQGQESQINLGYKSFMLHICIMLYCLCVTPDKSINDSLRYELENERNVATLIWPMCDRDSRLLDLLSPLPSRPPAKLCLFEFIFQFVWVLDLKTNVQILNHLYFLGAENKKCLISTHFPSDQVFLVFFLSVIFLFQDTWVWISTYSQSDGCWLCLLVYRFVGAAFISPKGPQLMFELNLVYSVWIE